MNLSLVSILNTMLAVAILALQCKSHPLSRCHGCRLFDPPVRPMDYADYDDSERLDISSICPWTTLMIEDVERVPRKLPSTTCTQSSVVFELNGRPVEYACELVEVMVSVMKYHPSSRYWGMSEEPVSVACTAVRKPS
jgi:hypothetical protein